MPFIQSTNPDVRTWTGLHLFHTGLSSCAQRVRIVLAEKNLQWKSHLLDFGANEHATEWYQSINPNGLVPTLIVDGRVLIESIDIIDWLDDTYPLPRLRPSESAAEKVMLDWMRRADSAQHSLKVLSHEFLFKPRKKLSAEALEEFVTQHRNEELRAFMRTFCSEAGFSKAKLDEELRVQHDRFVEMDAELSQGRDWLMGDQFTLADVAWAPNVHRMELMGYPLDRHPHLANWYRRISSRPSYQIGLENEEPDGTRAAFVAYTAERRSQGSDVTRFGPLAAG